MDRTSVGCQSSVVLARVLVIRSFGGSRTSVDLVRVAKYRTSGKLGRPCLGIRRMSGLGLSSDACSFHGSSSSCPSCLGSSPSWLVYIAVPWLASRHLITHKVFE